MASFSRGVGMSGWSVMQSSVAGTERDVTLLRFDMERLLRSDPGVEGLPLDRMDRSSASRDGTESEEVERS